MAQFRKDTHQYLSDGKTIFEVMMLADQFGNLIGPANPTGTAVDAFGRARSSQPFTLFDSFHRYDENDKFCTSNSAGGTYSFVSNTSSIDCTITTASGAYVYRETNKVFSYQPGKSLQIIQSFVMNPAKNNLRQRIGYFSATNGFFLENSGTSTVQFIKRSSVTGSVVDTAVTQSNWNIDKLDGTGASGLILNLDDPQILFIDMEWLGAGSVRMGFIINGQMIHCHSFHHANIDTSSKGAYIQTAVLPIRSEIENIGTTSSNSTFKEICSSVISEGGYSLSGTSYTIGNDPQGSNQFSLTTAGTYYPIVAIRLNPQNPDTIVIPTDIAIMPISASNYRYKLIKGGALAGAVWANTHSGSHVQYNTNSAAILSGGVDMYSSYVTSTVQGGGDINLSQNNFFKYQLERNSFANTQTTFILAITSGTATSNVCGSISWEEVT
jgi:hypothetical protein